jgi:hypothetical protein
MNDGPLLDFCVAFLAVITGNETDYGLVAGDSTALSAKVSAYQTAREATQNDTTRTPAAIETKDIAKQAVIGEMRSLYRKVLAANLPSDKLAALGLPIRDTEPTPVPVPTMRPQITVVSRDQNVVRLKLVDPDDPNRRGKPDGVDGVSVFSYVGEEPPELPQGWFFQGSSTRMLVDVEFPTSVAAGAKVWFTAFYYNTRAQQGPTAFPVWTNIAGGAASLAA